ncbi:(Fe-S)-binding protein [bacterium]|nr:(Fe-S)-binding protein [bacterium]
MIEFPITVDIDKCTHCGKCLYDCPLYEKYLDQVFSPRGKIILLEHHMNNNDILICSYCGNCVKQCPLNIDIPAHLLLSVWPKYFYKLHIKFNKKLNIKEKQDLIWQKMSKNDLEKDRAIIERADLIAVDNPHYYLFLKKLKYYNKLKFKLTFVHEKKNMALPVFMKGLAQKGDHFKNTFYYEK